MERILRDSYFRVTPARTPRAALAALKSRRFDLVLLDVHLTALNAADGLALISDLRKAGCDVPIIVLSGDGHFERAHEAARLGASGYLLKGRFDELPGLVGSILQSERTGQAPKTISPAAEAYLSTKGVSVWDLELLRDLATDFEREKEIARRLDRSEASVRKQFQKIREKLGANSQADLARILGVLSCFAPVRESEMGR